MTEFSPSPSPSPAPAPEDPIGAAFRDPSIPKIYANSFAGGVSTADMFVLLMTQGNPQAVVQMSFTVAKTLALELSRLISELESKTGQTIMTIPELQSKLFPPEGS